jgi:hypothetical protein
MKLDRRLRDSRAVWRAMEISKKHMQCELNRLEGGHMVTFDKAA